MPRKAKKPVRDEAASGRKGPLEKVIVARVLDEARRLGFFAVKMHGGPFMPKGLPDVLAIRNGRAVWIEVKRPGERPTAVQYAMMDKLAAAGCVVDVATSIGEAREILTRGDLLPVIETRGG